MLKDPEGIPALKTALYRGEWWAPRRSAALRRAAAGALARIGTPDALDVLDEALLKGGRGIRTVQRGPPVPGNSPHRIGRPPHESGE